jgi:hypothetical protein
VHDPIADYVERALEASCGALIALEQIHAARPYDGRDMDLVQARVAQATQMFRQAITSLRLVDDREPSWLAFGFVLEGRRSLGPAPGAMGSH